LLFDGIKYFNDHYAMAVQSFTPIIIGIISFSYYKFYKDSKLKEGDAALFVKPTFWFGKNYNIDAVIKSERSDDQSGYNRLSQNSRPDQWKQLIKIESSFCGMRQTVTPINPDDILEILISRNGKEKWKIIRFNK